ncbi:MAG: hypothetical protein PHG82_03140 [Candidatus Gracilibacteria bacterium]|nr:hypothetical protein [Candidatus Gracilibacteria bacterium]
MEDAIENVGFLTTEYEVIVDGVLCKALTIVIPMDNLEEFIQTNSPYPITDNEDFSMNITPMDMQNYLHYLCRNGFSDLDAIPFFINVTKSEVINPDSKDFKDVNERIGSLPETSFIMSELESFELKDGSVKSYELIHFPISFVFDVLNVKQQVSQPDTGIEIDFNRFERIFLEFQDYYPSESKFIVAVDLSTKEAVGYVHDTVIDENTDRRELCLI